MYTSEADFHKPGIYGGSEYGLPRGMCFVARRLELVAVAGRLWMSWCVLGGADFFRFSFRFSFFERTRAAASVRPPCLYVSSTSTGVRTGCHYLICLSVRLCITIVVFTDCESCTGPISTNRNLWNQESVG